MSTPRRLAVLFLLSATLVSAQPTGVRRATNLQALLAFPAYYHLRPVVLVTRVVLQDNGMLKIGEDPGSIMMVFKGNIPDGPATVRGELWDLGRMNPGDPQLAGYDLRETFKIDPESTWPMPGKMLALVASAVEPAQQPTAPSVRNVVLFPSRYTDQRITVIGQFGGRNLLGDLPDAPAQSRYDFVLRSADAAVWVSNIRPRGKDFDLSLDAKIDTGRWLEVTGMVRQARGLQWLEAEPGTLKLAKAPIERPIEEPIRVAPAPPPEVVFSAPTEGETDVATNTNVRIQFSRDIDQSTLRGRVHLSYEGAARPGPSPVEPAGRPQPEVTTKYSAPNRVLEITFTEPLQRFRTVRIALEEGILGTDKQAMTPWTLTFATGE